MTVRESTLPGVGKRFEIPLGGTTDLICIVHYSGKREVYVRDDPDADAERVLELDDAEARKVGAILEGAYFQPVPDQTIEAILDEDALIEWTEISEESPIAGDTIEGARIRNRTGVSVVAIRREQETIPSPEPDTVIEPGDTLITIGSREAHTEFHALVSTDTDEE